MSELANRVVNDNTFDDGTNDLIGIDLLLYSIAFMFSDKGDNQHVIIFEDQSTSKVLGLIESLIVE